MVFSSITFLFFFLPFTLGTYHILKWKYQNIFLLIMSLIFFAWGGPVYTLLILVSITINYVIGMLVQNPCRGKLYLTIGVVCNLILLIYFKYFNFIIDNINFFRSDNLVVSKVALPVGISFFTFQGMSYIIDVYRKETEGNKSFIEVALYITLFPQLIAGPIVKYKDIAEQMTSRIVTTSGVASGIERFIIGLSKKVLIADTMGLLVDNSMQQYTISGLDTPSAWLVIVCYSFQIYFDFSAYSDMAIGLAKLFGFDLLENFNYPYISLSITDFWRRWHISLSTWFKEYLYIPLGGNRRGNRYFNLLVVFIATGIWHGAQWQFVLWGLWHGIFLVLEKYLFQLKLYKCLPRCVKWMTTMLIVILGWVLFRADNLELAVQFLKSMCGIHEYSDPTLSFAFLFNRKIVLTLLLAIIGSTPLMAYMGRILNSTGAIVVKRVSLIGIFILCIVFVVSGEYSPFIYFQF